MPKAFITGVAGQDGSYLAEFLLAKGYEVCGLVRQGSETNVNRIAQLQRYPGSGRFGVVYGDLADSAGLASIIREFDPDEIYNLASQSFIPLSFEQPELTEDINARGPVRILEAIAATGKPTRLFQASTCEIFSSSAAVPQAENARIGPGNPYATSKLNAHQSVKEHRQERGMFACNGILFNHESPRRGPDFVTRKITSAAVRIKLGIQDKLMLGNLEVRKDWGYARDYVEAMWLMLQQEEPDDYVISSGESHTLTEFLDQAFGHLDLDWHKHVEVDPQFYRPTEIGHYEGDSSKAHRILGWHPKHSFQELVRLMSEHDMKTIKNIEPDPSPA